MCTTQKAFTRFNSCVVLLLPSRSVRVPQAGPGPGETRPQMTWERAEACFAPLPARQVSLHVTASSQRCILGEDNIQRWKHARHQMGALLTLSCDLASDMREDVPLGPRMPAFDAEWDSVKWLNITWPPQPPRFPPRPVYLPTVVRPRFPSAADAREAFGWQIVFSRWLLEPPAAF